ncbi:MAG: choice-of-anchor D domain-containing protein [Phycisphaerae bacterium]
MGKIRHILFEQLEPRILLSGDSLLNIAPNPDQDTILDNPLKVVQEAELLDTNKQMEPQINQELASSDTPNSEVCEPIITLYIDENKTIDESVDADLNVDSIGHAQTGEIALISNDFNGDIESKVTTTQDSSLPIYENDVDLNKEYATSIEIRGPPATESVALSEMHLVDPAFDYDYFDEQIVYLDFDGEENVTYNGPVTVEGIDVPAFVAPGDLAGQEDALIAGVVEELNEIFDGSGIIFTTERPESTTACSTIYVGGNDLAFAEYGSFLGLAEQVDVGNTDHSDNAFVFSDNTVSGQTEPTDPGSFVTNLANLICHETGHLLGYEHDNEDPNGGVLSIVAVADRFEPNDNPAEATDLGMLGNRTEDDLTIHEFSDEDYYFLTAGDSGMLYVHILFSHSLGDLDLTVYDSSGSPLAISTSSSDDESVSVAVTGGQTYYVRVYGYAGAANPNYDLVIYGPEPPGERFEFNDSFGAATDLGMLGDRTEADLTIHKSYNDDYYLLTAAYSGTLNVDILFSHSLGDLDLKIYDSSESLLASSISETDDEHVSVAVTGGQTYYVRVYGYAGATNPDYDLVIDGPEPPSPEIDVLGNGQIIVDGDSTPESNDGTDFRIFAQGGSIVRTFTIRNMGSAPLNLTGVPKVHWTGNTDFTVIQQPSSPVAASGGTTTFQIQFTPSGLGLQTATVLIANDDSDENPYDFAVQGTLTPILLSEDFNDNNYDG